jgi:hypothetical protein
MNRFKNSEWKLEPPVLTMENLDTCVWVTSDGTVSSEAIQDVKPGQPWMIQDWPDVYVPGKADDDVITQMLEVLRELQECSEYWSEYFVPIGIHERIANAIKAGEGADEKNL